MKSYEQRRLSEQFYRSMGRSRWNESSLLSLTWDKVVERWLEELEE